MLKKILCLIPAAGLLLTGGCSLFSSAASAPPAFYDLASQEAAPVGTVQAEFRTLADVTGNGLGIVTRLKDGRVVSDDLNRFSAPPVQLIRRRLTELFPAKIPGQGVKIGGTLCRFEIDAARSCALLVMDYHLAFRGAHKALRHRIETKLKGNSGRDAAGSLEECVILSARRLAAEVEGFKKECDKNKEEKK